MKKNEQNITDGYTGLYYSDNSGGTNIDVYVVIEDENNKLVEYFYHFNSSGYSSIVIFSNAIEIDENTQIGSTTIRGKIDGDWTKINELYNTGNTNYLENDVLYKISATN